MNSNIVTMENVNELKNNMIIINSYSDMHTKDELASENDVSKQKGDYKDIIHRR
jgi:hypothetical protein